VTVPSSEEKPAKPGNQPAEPSARRRILVVDDNEDAASTLAMLLQLTGNEVHTACDGLEAVKAVAELHPDIVLMDIGMPKLNGYDAARRIRGQASGKDTFLIAVSGWGQEEDKLRCANAGFNAHMTKPVDVSALTKLLSENAQQR